MVSSENQSEEALYRLALYVLALIDLDGKGGLSALRIRAVLAVLLGQVGGPAQGQRVSGAEGDLLLRDAEVGIRALLDDELGIAPRLHRPGEL